MKKAKACYADGGVIGPDGLTDAQRAKKNAALQGLGMSTTAPAPQQPATAPAPAPAPQPSATGQGILGIIGNRGKQIDKAAGYACGGKVKGHALGGKIEGIGTPTSDSIDASVRETGEQIKVSTGERIVSKAQDKLLQRLAKAMGYKSLDAYLEAGTGKPVGPTIKDGVKAAESGWDLVPYDEAKDPSRSFRRPGIDSPVRQQAQRLLPAPQPGTSVVPSQRPNWVPGSNAPPDTSAFDNEVRARAAHNRANPINYNKPMGNPAPVTPSSAVQGGMIRGMLTNPLTAIPLGVQAGMAAANFVDSFPSLRGKATAASTNMELAGTPQHDAEVNSELAAKDAAWEIRHGKSLNNALSQDSGSTAAPFVQDQFAKPVGFDNPAGVGQKISDIPVPGSKFVTGGAPDGISPVARGGFFEAGTTPPSSAQGGFTQGNKSYNVADTSQQGISRITATGANPLYTNIKPEDAVSGLSNQHAVQQATQQQEGIARIERANQIRGEMIDSAIKANGGNGVGILNTEQTLPGGMSISDWNNRVSSGFNTQMSPKEKAAYLAMEGAQGIQRTGQDLLNQQAAARNTLEARGQDLRSAREVDRDQVTMRGQDINALGDKAKLAMLERNDQRQADQFNLQRRISEGQLADSEAQRSARTAMAAALEKGDTEGYKQAVKQATIAGIKFDGEKSPKFAEIADPNDKSGLRKIPVQYNSDGTYTVMKPAAQQRTYAEFEKAYLAKRPGSTPEQMKADYQQLYGAK